MRTVHWWGVPERASRYWFYTCSCRVSAYAIPATKSPTTEPVVQFQHSQGQPQPGIAKEMKPSGNIMRSPQRGPLKYHRVGQRVMPTKKPISMRAL